jgi:CheY-like chemotaxis protein
MVRPSDEKINLERPAPVLLVDDEPAFCDVVAAILERRQYAVTRAHRISEAIAALKTRTPDVMLIDVMMPELDGLTLVRRLAHVPSW